MTSLTERVVDVSLENATSDEDSSDHAQISISHITLYHIEVPTLLADCGEKPCRSGIYFVFCYGSTKVNIMIGGYTHGSKK